MKTHISRDMNYMNRMEKREHLTKWSDFRIEAMKEAEQKFGKLSAENLKDIQKYMRTEEKKWKARLR